MSSKIRLLHGNAGLPQLEAYCSQHRFCQNISYNHCSEYFDIDHGSYNLSICQPNLRHQPLLEAYTYLPERGTQTAIISGGRENPGVFVVPDGFAAQGAIYDNAKAYMRFVNLAYDAPCLDFRFTDGAFVIANNIRYKEVTRYYPVTPSTYQMQATICNSSFVVLRVPAVTLRPGVSYTIYITGSARTQPYCSHIFTTDDCCQSFPPQPMPPFQPPTWCPPSWPPSCPTPVITTWDHCCGHQQPAPCCPSPSPCWDNDCSGHYYPHDGCQDPWGSCYDNHHTSGWSNDGICYDSGFTHYYKDHC